MKKSLAVRLTVQGVLLVMTYFVAVSVRADPNLRIKVFEPEKHEGVVFLPLSISEADDRLFDVRHDDRNNSWGLDVSKSRPTIEVHERNGVLGVIPVPEPTTMFLLGTGLAGLGGILRKRRMGAS